MKNTLSIYFNNTVAFIFFKLLSLKFFRRNNGGNSVLFINTGNLGDVVISGLIPCNDHLFKDQGDTYLLIKEEFAGLYKGYRGSVKIIGWNYQKYKWNIFYRLKFLSFLASRNFNETFNMTSARGVTCDEIALLSGAGKKYCINPDWLYLKKMFGSRMDALYDEVLCGKIKNEYTKHLHVIKRVTGELPEIKPGEISRLFNLNVTPAVISTATKGYIAVSPVASFREKTYEIEKFSEVCAQLSKSFYIILLGKSSERKTIGKIAAGNSRIINCAGEFGLEELPGIISNSRLYIGNDSGLTHIALMAGVPLIGIIGGGTFGKYFPYAESEKSVYLYQLMDCFGCEWNCHFAESHCINDIVPQRIISEARKLLTAKPAGKDFHDR